MQDLAAARAGDERAFRALIEPYRRELRAYCYRMAGSLGDADDLLQECLIRAWRGLPSFEGRSSLRTWLYRIALSACLDASKTRAARQRVEDQGPPADPAEPIAPPSADAWLGPCPASLYLDGPASPESRYSARESVGFAFLAALQLLPPKQRATLIACDVLGWSAEECAELIETSTVSVESALRRARKTIELRAERWQPKPPDAETTRALLARWVAAWDRADAAGLVALLHEDATMSMPPLPFWLHGSADIAASIGRMVFTPGAAGSFRFVATEANGLPAFAVHRRATAGDFVPYALQVLSLERDSVRGLIAFLDLPSLAEFDVR